MILSLICVIAGIVCFGIAAVARVPETPIRMGWLGLFFWALSTIVERL